MKRILIAVDDTKGSKAAFGFCTGVCRCMLPEKIVLLYVERFEGRSLMTEMLSDSELSTLKDVLQGTAYKEALDKKADDILAYYKKELEGSGLSTGVKTVRKIGHAAEEILKTAREEEAEMIIIGSRGNRVGHLFMGSVSREVANSSDIPVLIVK